MRALGLDGCLIGATDEEWSEERDGGDDDDDVEFDRHPDHVDTEVVWRVDIWSATYRGTCCAACDSIRLTCVVER